ncbi:hypothetical protein CASFOL_009147 [Castilleja foliolosa]|uniref:Uncharacterized protein n=1 Tax=Castilleja foliolosa TaxID=1961234 RepID=A0ABD3E1I6_9LAMI
MLRQLASEQIGTDKIVSSNVVPHEADAIEKSGLVTTKKIGKGPGKINHAQSSKSTEAANKLVPRQPIEAFVIEDGYY